MTATHHDLAVIGGGILGLAHAAVAAEAGARVLLLERNRHAVGASVRNFGMIWPLGQAAGEPLRRALRSRDRWISLARDAGFWLDQCGSLHAACREDELAVLREFQQAAPGLGYRVELLDPDEAARRSPGLRRDRLLGALWSETELAVDPREAVRALTCHLATNLGVDIRLATPVRNILHGPTVECANGEWFSPGAVVVCGGDDYRTLFPHVFASLPLTRCKLQMLRTRPQPPGWRLGPHLAGGLTLRHYACFEICPGLDALAARVSEEAPELDRHGVHVMAAQNEAGELVLGDSHEYGDEFSPDLSEEIDRLILRELSRWLDAPEPAIASRWHGVYSKSLDGATHHVAAPAERVRAVTGAGGAGMTLSFGIAEEVCAELGLTTPHARNVPHGRATA